MKTIQIAPFTIVGISERTTNENNQAATDIANLWGKFMSENVLAAIPNKVGDTIYSIYTDYEKDHTKPYTTILGCKVMNSNVIPHGLISKSFEGGRYIQLSAKGNLMNGLVADKWIEIWSMNLDRVFTADFEVYGEKAQNPINAEVDILIAVNK